MSDTFSTIAYAIAAGSIGFALALALTRPGQRSDHVLFFCVLLIALLAHVLGQLLIISDVYRLAPHLVGVDLSIKMALGPAVFFYTRALISPEKPGFGGLDWASLLGPALVILVSLPFAGLSAEEKLALVDPATRNPVQNRAVHMHRVAFPFSCLYRLLSHRRPEAADAAPAADDGTVR